MSQIDLDLLTPDATIPATCILFGADDQAAGPTSVYPLSSLWQKLVGSTAFSGDTVTASKPLLDLVQTWNNAAVGFTLLKINAVNTASATLSYVFDAQVGGSSVFSVRKDGLVTSSIGGGLTFNSSGGYTSIGVGNSGLVVPSVLGIGASDTLLNRDAANTLAQRNGTAAQAFNVYNTYTDASNYERLGVRWSSNVAYLGPQKAGTGSDRLLVVQTGIVTVVGLPSASASGAGARAMVSDATATTFASTVSGGGANKVPVVSDGTNWLIG